MSIDNSSERKRLEELHAFIGRLEQAGAPAFAEIFCEETKKVRIALLTLALLATLLATGSITLSTGAVDAVVGKIEYSTTPIFAAALAATLAFLVMVYIARCFVDWHVWQFKKMQSDTNTLVLLSEITEELANNLTLRASVQDELIADLKSGGYGFKNLELSKTLMDLTSGPEAVHREQKQHLFDAMLAGAITARRLRLWLEVAFPIAFSGAAIGVLLLK